MEYAEPKRIVLLGTGKVATHLALALQGLDGYRIIQLYGRRASSIKRILDKLSEPIPYTSSIEDIQTNADYYIFALSDTALASVFAQMPQTTGIWVHTAGSVALSTIAEHHLTSGVLYPLQTFSLEKSVCWRDIPIYIEATEEVGRRALEQLAQALSAQVSYATTLQREALHLGAVMACNFSNHLIAQAQSWLSANGLEPEALMPLLRETFAKLETMSAYEAQTGPAVRGDRTTIERHEALLKHSPKLLALYRFLSESIVQEHSDSKEIDNIE